MLIFRNSTIGNDLGDSPHFAIFLGSGGDFIRYFLGGEFDVVREGLGGGVWSRAGIIWAMSYLLHEELESYVFGDFQLWLRYMLVIPVRRAVWLVTHLKRGRMALGEDNQKNAANNS